MKLSKPYNFHEFTSKDLFLCNLEGTIPFFEYVARDERMEVARKMHEFKGIDEFACTWYLAELNFATIIYERGVHAGVDAVLKAVEYKSRCWTLTQLQDVQAIQWTSVLSNKWAGDPRRVFIDVINIDQEKMVDITRIRT
jgi:hypothetical protein